MKTFLPIANGLALIITIFVNYLGNAGIFNGNTMATVSERYANFFTPAGYAFSIWGIIYLGLLGFVLYTGRGLFTKKETDPILFKIRWLFVFTCLANSLWVMTWLNDYIGLSVIIMVFLLVGLLKIILVTRMELDYHPLRRYLFIFWPFALYAGWISVALIANIAAWLTKINWDGWGISPVTWTVIMIGVAGLVNVFMIATRNLREYGLVGIWALIAIAVANNADNGSSTVVYACYIVAFVILIAIVANALKSRRISF
ncbi:tryptophan-rich sensory protein [Sphingobacterium chuzhouense]|uniref:Tryptophan-rich sensory protein n=1 Tax=Sphingobacterium chuzhouense TaxID=1742264 RepID=A0ABR7XQZ8_9SPHI|nr:tryptophan-rich sensory protein [Sphingobacterium chuzhouense]MBD1421580.1 tryptophan-rich sensory protein [Sphingobacterium chuzhouense]